MSMQEPLTMSRTSLIALLQQRLKEREDAREAERNKQREELDAAGEALGIAMSEHPQLIVFLVNQVATGMGLDATDDGFAEAIAKHYDYPKAAERKHDESLRKLIRVYEAAEDENVQIHVGDSAYAYL